MALTTGKNFKRQVAFENHANKKVWSALSKIQKNHQNNVG